MAAEQPTANNIDINSWIEGNIDAFAQEHKDLKNLQQSISDGIDRQECISILEKFKDKEKIFGGRENSDQHVAVAVVGVQAALHHLGYKSVGEIDGFFGKNTKAAVKNFQEDWNEGNSEKEITVDGFPGPITVGKLIKKLEEGAESAVANVDESSVTADDTGAVADGGDGNGDGSNADQITGEIYIGAGVTQQGFSLLNKAVGASMDTAAPSAGGLDIDSAAPNASGGDGADDESPVVYESHLPTRAAGLHLSPDKAENSFIATTAQLNSAAETTSEILKSRLLEKAAEAALKNAATALENARTARNTAMSATTATEAQAAADQAKTAAGEAETAATQAADQAKISGTNTAAKVSREASEAATRARAMANEAAAAASVLETLETEQKIASVVKAAMDIVTTKGLTSPRSVQEPFNISRLPAGLEFDDGDITDEMILEGSHKDWQHLTQEQKETVVSQLNKWWEDEKDLARTLAEEDAEYL